MRLATIHHLCIAAMIATIPFAAIPSSVAAAPERIHYQGDLRSDEGDPVTGSVDFQFRIFAAATGGSSLWTESHTGVSVEDGLFGVVLGSVTPLPGSVFDSDTRWLETVVEGTPLVPRRQFLSTPYALRAAVADVALNGAADEDWLMSGDDVYRLEGDVGLGTASPTANIHVYETVDVTADLRLEKVGGSTLTAKAQNSSSSVGTDSNHAFRLLTNNTVRMHIDTSGNVGVGTVNPAARLDVNGTLLADEVVGDNLRSATTLGSAGTPGVGRVYTDNMVYAWAQIRGDGVIEASHGVNTVTRLGTGWYRITYRRSLPNGAIPVVTPYSANDIVNTRISSSSSSQCEVRTALWVPGNGDFLATDYRFLVQVVGRP